MGGQALTDQAATAAKFTADGNDIVAHDMRLLKGRRCPGFTQDLFIYYIIADGFKNDNENMRDSLVLSWADGQISQRKK